MITKQSWRDVLVWRLTNILINYVATPSYRDRLTAIIESGMEVEYPLIRKVL